MVTLDDKDQRATEFSLAGRAEDVELQGFSQGELANSRERFIDRLLAGVTAGPGASAGEPMSLLALSRSEGVAHEPVHRDSRLGGLDRESPVAGGCEAHDELPGVVAVRE